MDVTHLQKMLIIINPVSLDTRVRITFSASIPFINTQYDHCVLVCVQSNQQTASSKSWCRTNYTVLWIGLKHGREEKPRGSFIFTNSDLKLKISFSCHPEQMIQVLYDSLLGGGQTVCIAYMCNLVCQSWRPLISLYGKTEYGRKTRPIKEVLEWSHIRMRQRSFEIAKNYLLRRWVFSND